MSSNEARTYRRATTCVSQMLNWVAFAILFIFVGIAIIH